MSLESQMLKDYLGKEQAAEPVEEPKKLSRREKLRATIQETITELEKATCRREAIIALKRCLNSLREPDDSETDYILKRLTPDAIDVLQFIHGKAPVHQTIVRRRFLHVYEDYRIPLRHLRVRGLIKSKKKSRSYRLDVTERGLKVLEVLKSKGTNTMRRGRPT